MKKKEMVPTPKKVLNMSLPIVAAIFIIVTAVLYIIYRSWSNKAYFERWKDYEDCGI